MTIVLKNPPKQESFKNLGLTWHTCKKSKAKCNCITTYWTMINRGLGPDQSRKIEGDILWWRLWQSLRWWIMMCNLYQHQPVVIWECSQKKLVFWKGNIRSEINGTTVIWLTYSSKALCCNNSNNQTGNSSVAPEAQHCTIRLHLIHLVKLQDLPIFRNHSMPLQICFHREYTELQTKIAPGKENISVTSRRHPQGTAVGVTLSS